MIECKHALTFDFGLELKHAARDDCVVVNLKNVFSMRMELFDASEVGVANFDSNDWKCLLTLSRINIIFWYSYSSTHEYLR